MLLNDGHNNIDNNGEIFSPGKLSTFNSFRFTIKNLWLSISLEPYLVNHSDFNRTITVNGPFRFNNHAMIARIPTVQGLRQSEIILHYKNFGFSLGKKSHWWGPGFHSSIILSTNSPSQKTMSFGTFNEIRYKKFGFFGKVIGLPYKSRTNRQLYLTGFRGLLTFYSDQIISIGLNRVYFSGDFTDDNIGKWGIEDALSLIFEPLYGQSKKGLYYTIEGTPGFDYWDEVISASLKIKFPKDKIEFYLDIASDDNRGNFTDLRAHWDHTLGYQIGAIKQLNINQNEFLIAAEQTSLRESNTFKSSFYRGKPNIINFYRYPRYDFSTYEGRFIGSHSGSSSTDLIFVVGMRNNIFSTYASIGFENCGLKFKEFPERKSELAFSFKKLLFKYHSIFIRAEYEKISNFRFINNNISTSKSLQLGYSISFNK